MRSFFTVSIVRNVGIVVAVFGMLIAGTWAAVKFATDYLLYQNATSTASGWARYLAENVGDLEQIAAGEQPSTTSMTFFKGARRGGQVFRYEIFNRQGYSQLASDQDKIAPVEISEFSIDAAHSIAAAQPVVAVKEGNSPNLPSFYAQAYVPIFVDRRPIAIVAAYVDQTDQRDNFYRTFLIEAVLLCLMTGLSFLIPMIGWLRRTKEKQQADRHIRFLAYHDALTGLANRTQLIEKLQMALVLASSGGGFAVHFIDLDRFKEVNDTFGHDGGDFLLKTVAERLRAVTRPDDVVARLGGDEFVVIQSSANGKDEAEAFADRLISALRPPINFNEHELIATISIGSALAPEDGADPERLLKCADLALYEAKASGRNCVRFFLPEMDGALQNRIDLERTLRHAVLHERFVLHYQPVFGAKASHQLRGFEALLRLPREDGTLIPPMAFIPVAEDMRLIGEIGR
jgi:diguanylate cyclase (GGDEF)-like protein